MVDKRYQWRRNEDVRTRFCKICKAEFQTNRASDCHCGDECRAESKRRHAREASRRKQLISKRHQQEKQKKKLQRDITSPLNAKLLSVAIKIPTTRKKNSSSSNCVGIPKSTSQRDKRPCLKCQKLFDSEWIGNRVCATCQNQNVSLGGRETKFTPDRGIFRGNY